MAGIRGILRPFGRNDSTSDNASISSSKLGKNGAPINESFAIPVLEEQIAVANATLNPGELSFDEDTAGGRGRHLGVFSCTLLIVGRIIGTGIFSTPSSILTSVNSIGASLMLWVLGLVLSFCGLFVWLEYGTMFPRSGGEKVYLEAVYKKPKYLATVFYATQAILLGFSSSNCIVFAQNILVVAGHEADRWTTRGIALGVIVFVTIAHGFTPRIGLFLTNALSVFKIFILVFIIVTGWVVLGGHTSIKDPHANFRNAFAGSSHSSSDYATAIFKNPVRTLKIAGPLGLGICAVLYLLANVAYFAAATKEEIMESGVTVASLFFEKVFGTEAQRALTVFVALSALGVSTSLLRLIANYLLIVVAAECHDSNVCLSRLNQELAKEGIPLPFGNKFWASNWPTGKSPVPGLIMHLIPTVIVIIAPPPNVAYPFILDLEGYPAQIINLLVVLGLFWLRYKKPNAHRPFKVWWPFAGFFLAAAVFLIVDPFLRPANGVGDTPPLPYYLYCIIGISVLIAGIVYWAAWSVVLPRVFRYELVPEKETLSDGTVVIVFQRKKLQ
ncbi:high affinity methionine permease [Phellopilus nigrolimitatus]|nr:high affinity methionine permease [Phellopilus nigrolimitatus]